MPGTSETLAPANITFVVGISLQGPITPGEYEVDYARIRVCYPDQVTVGLPSPIRVPRGVSTVFVVSWPDTNGKTREHLKSESFERHLPIHAVLDLINKLFIAFKMVRVGHADGMRLRTVGISDTLFYWSMIDETPTGDLNIGMRLDRRDYSWSAGQRDSIDPHETTKLALPHVNSDSYPIARRYVRCFELLEHGFYKETVIVAHAILDDLVQEVIDTQLQSRGLDNEQSRELLIRAVKEYRLKIYLGPLLKVLAGNSINEIWPEAETAIAWLNSSRNKIAHGGSSDDRNTACKSIFVSIKTVAALHHRGLLKAEFPPGMFRQARITAAWTPNAESWVPSGEAIEVDPLDPHSSSGGTS